MEDEREGCIRMGPSNGWIHIWQQDSVRSEAHTECRRRRWILISASEFGGGCREAQRLVHP